MSFLSKLLLCMSVFTSCEGSTIKKSLFVLIVFFLALLHPFPGQPRHGQVKHFIMACSSSRLPHGPYCFRSWNHFGSFQGKCDPRRIFKKSPKCAQPWDKLTMNFPQSQCHSTSNPVKKKTNGPNIAYGPEKKHF